MNRLTQQGAYRYNELLHESRSFLSRRFPTALWQGDPAQPTVALTFDDGPSQRDLGRILASLDAAGAVATFFFIGEKVPAAPDMVRAVARAGHQIGLHGYRHRPFTSTRPELLRAELLLARTLIGRLCGWCPEQLRDVRPPYGMFSPATLRALDRWGYRAVMWSLVPFHWQISAPMAHGQIQRRLRSGSLIVLHEDMAHGPPVGDLLDTTLAHIRSAGLRTITIDEMWRSHPRAPAPLPLAV